MMQELRNRGFRVACLVVLLACVSGCEVQQETSETSASSTSESEIASATCGPTTIIENPREIPIAHTVDVVVIGGGTRGVAAAVAAKESGGSVFLAAERPYLGADLCATWRLWLTKDEKPGDKLSKAIFGDTGATTPMNAKLQLDRALLDADVPFLFGCYVTDILQDSKGRPAGIVMANRSGRQAVIAKVVIDATDRGVAARQAGAEFAPYRAGKHIFKRVVLGGTPGRSAKRLDAVLTPHSIDQKTLRPKKDDDPPIPVYEYTIEIDMPDGSWSAFANADRFARNQTWHDNQASASEQLFQTPPDPLQSRKHQAGPWPGADKIDLDALRPKEIDRFYVLGGCADLSRQAAAMLLRPLNGIALGRRTGAAAAQEASGLTKHKLSELTIRCDSAEPSRDIVVGEMLQGTRSRAPLTKQPTITSPSRKLPVLARVDAVVVGGGTGGAPAGIGAVRGGAKTLVIEYLNGLGGIGTMGKINNYWHGNQVGFTDEVTKATGGRRWNIEKRMEWCRREIVKAGGEVWYQSLGCGSVVRDKRFVGVVVATPFGRGVVLANTVIDSTGNAVIPACAGAPTVQIGAEHIRVQGTGLPPSAPGGDHFNTDWTFADDDDVVDMWRMFVIGKNKYAEAVDIGQLIDTRSRRTIIGDIFLTPLDIWNKRTFPDTITVAKSNYDNHGFTIHEMFMFPLPRSKGDEVGHIPYRALMPKGYDGILVTGLGISAHCDAMPILRMQADVQNQGYAAGKAAAMVAREGKTVRRLDVKALQKHLVEIGSLEEAQLTDKDSYPLSAAKMQTAVDAVGADYQGITKVLTDPKAALPMLRRAWERAPSKDVKLRYAHVLGMLYDNTGAQSLIAAVKANPWDKGRAFVYWGGGTTPMENLIIALGRTGDKRGITVILEKLKELADKPVFSHCRAVAYALEEYRDPAAAKPLAELLSGSGMSGHAFVGIKDALKRTPVETGRMRGNDNSTRNNSLRELILARALYRCGDHEGIAEKILISYTNDLRGHYAAHAKAILSEAKK
ncbi:MAG: FAD-dependent oxidoreductase [Phycisphaerales bacterium]|jgi:hypothetical protein|nr:FAD-dependent oxidoreductase [Phycisphaerales bacterium]